MESASSCRQVTEEYSHLAIHPRTALLVDDHPEEMIGIKKDLESMDILVLLVPKATDAKKQLESRPEIGLIVIDWYLSDDLSIETQDLIRNLKNKNFAPIIVYTKEDHNAAEKFLQNEKLGRISMVLDKNIVTADRVITEFNMWTLNNPDLRLFMMWAYQAEWSLNSSLWDIHNLSPEGVKYLLSLLKNQSAEVGPLNNEDTPSYVPEGVALLNLMARVMARKISCSPLLRKELENALAANSPGTVRPQGEEGKCFDALKSLERYITPPVAVNLWTGDVLRCENGDYYVVVTPACDLCHEKTESVLLLPAMPFYKFRKHRNLPKKKLEPTIQNSKPSTHFLHYLMNEPHGIVCEFDRVFSVSKRDLLSEIRDLEADGLTVRVATLDSPYIENLIQRMTSYIMRLGIEDIPDEEATRILSETMNP